MLDRFIQCASLWADHIIIADQYSDDGSAEIAKSYDKVIYIKNESIEFNEPERQKILINEARKIDGEKILIALDADEIITSNFMHSNEWDTMLESPIGTIIKFQWANLYEDMQTCWIPNAYHPWGFIDDGSEHLGTVIHSHRVPVPSNAPSLCLNDIKVMHYQYTDVERMKSKQRWYQVWERINNNRNSSVYLFRLYNHMNALNTIKKIDVDPGWFKFYEDKNIDMTSIKQDGLYRWDRDILDLFVKYNSEYFKKVPIWDVEWDKKAEQLGFVDYKQFQDPRGYVLTMLHYWLIETQADAKKVRIRVIDELLKILKF